MGTIEEELGFEEISCDRCGHTWTYKGRKARAMCNVCGRVLYTKYGRESYLAGLELKKQAKREEGKMVFDDIDVGRNGEAIPMPGKTIKVGGTEYIRPVVDKGVIEIILKNRHDNDED
ncbi:MAG: hypothetical protein QXL94_03090 [Candidatus Parvarchaeum sp.]